MDAMQCCCTQKECDLNKDLLIDPTGINLLIPFLSFSKTLEEIFSVCVLLLLKYSGNTR